jgi:pyridoxine 5-phosphate synthase
MVSLFIAPDPRQVEAAARLGAPCIELHTGAFCDRRGAAARSELRALAAAARQAHALGLQVNAGHGINLDNVGDILRMPHLDTLNIGHSIICQAVFVGIKQAVRDMLAALKPYKGGQV